MLSFVHQPTCNYFVFFVTHLAVKTQICRRDRKSLIFSLIYFPKKIIAKQVCKNFNRSFRVVAQRNFLLLTHFRNIERALDAETDHTILLNAFTPLCSYQSDSHSMRNSHYMFSPSRFNVCRLILCFLP